MARNRSSNPERGGWGRLSKVMIPSIYYNLIPDKIARNYTEWPHDKGSFFYNNSEYLWEGSTVDLQGLFERGNSGYDHSLYDFFRELTPYVFSNILYDPEKTARHAVVYKDEWEKVGKTTVWTWQTGAYRTKPGSNAKKRRK